MKIAVYGPLYNERSKSTIKILIEYLKNRSVDVFFEKDFYESVLKISNIDIESFRCDNFKSLDNYFDLFIIIGGD